MGDDFWGSSAVSKAANRHNIFDMDEDDPMTRFKKESNPMLDGILDSSRNTSATRGAASARLHPPNSTTAITNPPPQPAPVIQPTARPVPSPNTRPADPTIESARFNRHNRSTSDSNSSSHWYPTAEEYPEQSTKDRSTQFDQEMNILCRQLLENKPVKLDDIRDYDKKASLLRMAISFNTPSVTVPVIIFLENSLSSPLFYELIKQHPSAVRSYINMAKPRLKSDYHIAMLKQFGRNEEVAMIRLQQLSEVKDINAKLAIVDQAATELGSHPWWHLQVAEQRLLLLKQRESQHSQPYQTVLNSYKAVYKEDFLRTKTSRNSNRVELDRSREYESTFHMAPEMIMCAKLSSIMHCGMRPYYKDFVHQAIHQGIFGKKYIIAPEYLADMVYNWAIYSNESSEEASQKAEQFLKMIVDPNKRLYYAEKFQNYEVAIDTIANVLRDRFQLDNLRRRMPRDHPAYNQATALLENTKWRN